MLREVQSNAQSHTGSQSGRTEPDFEARDSILLLSGTHTEWPAMDEPQHYGPLP